jgi:hypothetical protein
MSWRLASLTKEKKHQSAILEALGSLYIRQKKRISHLKHRFGTQGFTKEKQPMYIEEEIPSADNTRKEESKKDKKLEYSVLGHIAFLGHGD